jgi:signal transduction histidine kinase
VKAAAVRSELNVIRNSTELGADCGYQQLVSDIFHDVSQPLSTLTCLLEINLLLSRTAKQWRHDVKIGLKQVRSIVGLMCAHRELWEAGNEQQDQQVLSIGASLKDAVADLLPAAELANVKLLLACGVGFPVTFQASRLRQGLVHLLEFALDSCASGGEIKITADEKDETGRVTVASSVVSPSKMRGAEAKALAGEKTEESDWKRREFKRRVGLAVAWRIFNRADGILQIEENAERLRIDLLLPLASSPR